MNKKHKAIRYKPERMVMNRLKNFSEVSLKLIKIVSFLLFIVLGANSCSHETKPGSALLSEEEKFNRIVDSLKNAGDTRIQIANEIRRYLAGVIDIGKSRHHLESNYYKIHWKDLSPFRCIELFKRDSLTAKCGLSSYILAKLYEHAGFETFIYDCGYPDGKNSHQFVLVKLNGNLIVEDAYFNVTINDKDNQPMDFLRLLSEVKTEDFSNIRVAQDDALTECWLDSKAELDSLLKVYKAYEEFYRKQARDISVVDNRVRILLVRNFSSLTTPALERMKSKLQDDGLPENFLSIYIKPLHVIDGTTGQDADSLRRVIEEIVLSNAVHARGS